MELSSQLDKFHTLMIEIIRSRIDYFTKVTQTEQESSHLSKAFGHLATYWPHVFDDSAASGQSIEDYTNEKYYTIKK